MFQLGYCAISRPHFCHYFFLFQAKVNEMQVKVGEVDRSMDDVIATLDQLQDDIKNQEDVTGDPKHLETILRKLQVKVKSIIFSQLTNSKENTITNKEKSDLLYFGKIVRLHMQISPLKE
jgi:hypothetical protein